jgi:hypothetical protein
MQCPNCGHEGRDTTRFCARCGRELPGATTDAAPDTPPGVPSMTPPPPQYAAPQTWGAPPGPPSSIPPYAPAPMPPPPPGAAPGPPNPYAAPPVQQYGQPIPPYAPPGYGYGYGPSTNGLAIASLVLGIVGGVACVGWIVAIVLGAIARNQIRNSGGRQKGAGMALAGIILGCAWAVLFVLYIVVLVAVSSNSSTS